MLDIFIQKLSTIFRKFVIQDNVDILILYIFIQKLSIIFRISATNPSMKFVIGDNWSTDQFVKNQELNLSMETRDLYYKTLYICN
jgi:hypothetical protein